MILKTLSLLMAFLVFGAARTCGAEPADTKSPSSPKMQISRTIADHFVGAMRSRNYTCLTEDKLESLRKEIRQFAAKYRPVQLSVADQQVLLGAIDQYVREYFLNRGLDSPKHFPADYDMEGAYLKFRDSVNTFKWKLWLAVTRKPLTTEQLSRREVQHDWLREFIAGVPIRPGDATPIGVAPGAVRTWASAYLERKSTDPLSLLYDPMSDRQFEVFKKLMARSSANGLYNTVRDVPVRALGARAHNHTDVEKAYAYPFDIELPFEDEVRSIWGGGDGAGPHLAFASNAQFRGQDVFLDARYRPIFDTVKGLCLIEPQEQAGDPDESIARWTQKHQRGDIAYHDAKASIASLRGAEIAELKVANWFEADRVSNAELHRLINEKGQTVISVKRLPPMNGPRRVGFNEPRFFIVVRNCDGRLAVMDLRSREFGLNLVSRLRSTDSVTSAPTMQPGSLPAASGPADSASQYNHFVFLEQRTDSNGALVRAFVLAQIKPTGFLLRDIFTATGKKRDLASRWQNIRLLCVSRGQLYLNRGRDLLSIDLSTGLCRLMASGIWRSQDWYDDGRLYTLDQMGVVRVYDLRIGASRTITSLTIAPHRAGPVEIRVSPDHTKLAFLEKAGSVSGIWMGASRYRLNVLDLGSNKHTRPFEILYMHRPIPGGSFPPPPLVWLDEQNLLFVRAQVPADSFPQSSLLELLVRTRSPKQALQYRKINRKIRRQFRPSDFYEVQGPSGGAAARGLGIRHDVASINVATGEVKSIAELPISMVKFLEPTSKASKVRVTSRYGQPSMDHCWNLDPNTGELTEDDTCVGAFQLCGESWYYPYNDHYALEIFHGDRPLNSEPARQGLLISICPAGNRVIWSPIRGSHVFYYDQDEQQVRSVSIKRPPDQHFLWIADKDLARAATDEQLPPGWTAFGQADPASSTP
jgi:hypothetical protein